ncbi:P-loop containing nucleoside triphosphate hydrolase protein [Talaromyces proteolyticus]|uniref:P-loop containing nucleoside triphosphate hydrolase protein n=1 Tax=Talaromyces proteolyticus TaxID=1131652 RepID=A0AAD4KM36_9EURO|nr:P-loop containing nucleoside triphosphate hydrolase protein [Talaromyces proteolyticus]KAH8692286.1 P-loop containing nucleoside triphosphate hydrolase protein [Talaromyces proteolyticus]
MEGGYDGVSDRRQEQSSDMHIAVMGVTGAGKSSFISLLSDERPTIGHTLEACTQHVTQYSCTIIPGRNVYLIDTPGFDDTNRSDTEVLRELAHWLTTSYANDIKLTEIIYFHRISDVRMPGSAVRNILMFKKLCGEHALKHVVLATSMWDKVSEDEGVKREKDLVERPEWWGGMINKGSRMFRHRGDRASAERLLKQFLSVAAPTVLHLQRQMVDEEMRLDQTSAGIELEHVLAREREKFQRELSEAKE